MGLQVIPQPVDGQIGVDDTHDGTDEEQQQQNLYAVVNKKVEGTADFCVGTQTDKAVNQPICKILNHNTLILKEILKAIIQTDGYKQPSDNPVEPLLDDAHLVVETTDAMGAECQNPCHSDDGQSRGDGENRR